MDCGDRNGEFFLKDYRHHESNTLGAACVFCACCEIAVCSGDCNAAELWAFVFHGV